MFMKRFVVPIAVLALVATACGGDADSSPATSAASTPTTTTAVAQLGELAVSPGIERLPANPDAPIAELVTGLNGAGFGLWHSQAADGNFVFSPMSIGHALLLARGAADDITGAAIDRAIGLPAGVAAHDAWNAVEALMSADAAAEEEITVTMADRIWPRRDVEPSQDWVDLLVSHHGVTVQPDRKSVV